jgi:predicted ester cyclase
MSFRLRHLGPLVALGACSATPTPGAKNPEVPTSTAPHQQDFMTNDTPARNEQTVRKIYEECVNTGDLARLAEFVDVSYVGPNGERGPEGFAATVGGLRAGFPDIHFTLEDLVADGDRVALRWTWGGTHQNSFRGFEPTGKRVTNTAIGIYELRHGKVVRAWLQTDRLGFLETMGALPESVTARLRGGPPNPAAPQR